MVTNHIRQGLLRVLVQYKKEKNMHLSIFSRASKAHHEWTGALNIPANDAVYYHNLHRVGTHMFLAECPQPMSGT